jgi:hypothetical protein
MYRELRNYHNLQRRMFEGVGEYDIPMIQKQDIDIEGCTWVSFNSAPTWQIPGNAVCHFFLDDYQFERLWANPDEYVALLSRFRAITSPDFSLYADFPKSVQIFNHFRKHWLAAYYQEHGIKVIPTACWYDEMSYDWCFDGDPKDAVVAISDIGTMVTAKNRERFYIGYDTMMNRLSPQRVFLYTSNLDLERFDEKTASGSERITLVSNANIDRLRQVRKKKKRRRRR